MARGWPVSLGHDAVGVRALRQRDRADWWAVRRANVDWLTPWDSTIPEGDEQAVRSFNQMVWTLRRLARAGRAMPFAMTYEGRLVGQLTVNGITWGSARWANMGYWVDRRVAGRGIVPTAVALVCDHLFEELDLHRVEIAIRPENRKSLRVVEKLGFTEFGYAPGYLHIAGEWADHRLFQLLADDVPEGVLNRYLTVG